MSATVAERSRFQNRDSSPKPPSRFSSLVRARCEFGSRLAAFAILMPGPSKDCSPSSGRGFRDMRSSGESKRVGSGVLGWTVGQRVGVGFLAGSCGYCVFCRNGDLVNCANQGYTGVHHDGGYAEVMIAKASGLVSIPDELSSAQAAPLLCAGLTTFSALRNAPAKAGDLVAVLGIGGLGHLGVQYARHMGFEVAAIERGADKASVAKELGAHHYIDSGATDPAPHCKRSAAPS